MTVKLYDEKPYETDFQAKVLDWETLEDEKGEYKRAVLDQTLFFPNQGGQSADTGLLGNYIVENVIIESGIITHILREEIKADIYRLRDYEPGDTILGSVDWKHRFSNMQQHTGEHIFTGIAHNKYGVENVGFHLSDNEVTLDLDKYLTDEDIAWVEKTANAVITGNVPVRAFYPTAGELDALDYRCKAGIEGAVRLVEIAGVDLCACCAPHVRSTGEVGFLKVVRHEKYKGGVRIWILCGARALTKWQEDMRVIDGLVREMTCQPVDLLKVVHDLKDKKKQLAVEVAQLKQEKLLAGISHLSLKGKNILSVFETGLDIKCMREVVNAYVGGFGKPVIILSGDDDAGYDFVAGCSSDTDDIRLIVDIIKSHADVKGGGSKAQVQGHINADAATIENALKEY